jgi:hypothetical protein
MPVTSGKGGCKNAISSMYVTSAILKGIKADATEIFMNKKKEYFPICQTFFQIWVIAC